MIDVALMLQMPSSRRRSRYSGRDCPRPRGRQETVTIQIPYRRSGASLSLLVDSTGVRMSGDGEWLVRKHGPSRRRQWREVHLAMDAATGGLRAEAGRRGGGAGREGIVVLAGVERAQDGRSGVLGPRLGAAVDQDAAEDPGPKKARAEDWSQ